MAERFLDFEIKDIQGNSEIQNTEKVHRPGSVSGPAGPKTRTLNSFCSPTIRKLTDGVTRLNFSGCSLNR